MAVTGFATIQDVRNLVGLPAVAAFPDSKIEYNLASAKLLVNELISDYSGYTGNDKARALEAECCFTAYYGIVAWNTFFTSTIENFQTEAGEAEAQFFNPDQINTNRDYWYQRGTDRISIFKNENTDLPSVGWYAV